MVEALWSHFIFVGAQQWQKIIYQGHNNVKYLERQKNCKVQIKWSTSKSFFCGGTTNGKKYLVSAQQSLKLFSEVHEWQRDNLVGYNNALIIEKIQWENHFSEATERQIILVMWQ